MNSIRGIVSNNVVVVQADASIDAVIKTMQSNGISCVLVAEKSGSIVGIVTERDVLKKISLLDVDRKLQRGVRAIMTTPVQFVRTNSLVEDILKLRESDGIRHFPVSSGPPLTNASLVGIVTVTDLSNAYLRELEDLKNELLQKKDVG